MLILCEKRFRGQAQNIIKSYHWLTETFGQAIKEKLQISLQTVVEGGRDTMAEGRPGLGPGTHMISVSCYPLPPMGNCGVGLTWGGKGKERK